MFEIESVQSQDGKEQWGDKRIEKGRTNIIKN